MQNKLFLRKSFHIFKNEQKRISMFLTFISHLRSEIHAHFIKANMWLNMTAGLTCDFFTYMLILYKPASF